MKGSRLCLGHVVFEEYHRVREPNLLALWQVAGLLPDEYEVVPLMANLVVDQSLRRKGVGLALFEAAQAKCSEWGFDRLWLEVEASNAPARNFYEKVKTSYLHC